MDTIIFGKKVVGRYETLEYARDKFGWKDIIIGVSAFYGFWAWVVGRLTRRKVIYYCIDFYSPLIAENLWDSIFIKCAMLLDQFLILHCDVLWDISPKINEGRRKFGKYMAIIQYIVPMCYPPRYFKFNIHNSNRCVFVGLTPYGKELMPEDTLMIRGDLPLDKMLYKVSRCAIGLGLWEKNGNNYYGDPGKTKLYLACGIPIITTDNNPSAELVKKYHCGIVCKYSKRSVDYSLRKIFNSYSYYKKNVLKAQEEINADNIFGSKDLLE